MTEMEIIELINTSLAEEFELNKEVLKPQALILDDLELDSLDIVDMVVLLENAFQFKIREEDALREIRTLGDIHNFVLKKRIEMLN